MDTSVREFTCDAVRECVHDSYALWLDIMALEETLVVFIL